MVVMCTNNNGVWSIIIKKTNNVVRLADTVFYHDASYLCFEGLAVAFFTLRFQSVFFEIGFNVFCSFFDLFGACSTALHVVVCQIINMFFKVFLLNLCKNREKWCK